MSSRAPELFVEDRLEEKEGGEDTRAEPEEKKYIQDAKEESEQKGEQKGTSPVGSRETQEQEVKASGSNPVP